MIIRAKAMLLEPSSSRVEVHEDPGLMRPADVTLPIPSVEKFYKATGWKPIISLEQTLQDLLDYWRSRV